MKGSTWQTRLLIWRIKHISTSNFILLISAVIGLLAGLAAVTLKQTVHGIAAFAASIAGYDLFRYVLPLIGIVLTVFFARSIFREPFGHGITSILFAISKKGSLLPRTRMYSNLVGSAITVGLGGSAGLEAPIVVTGSAIGSNIGKLTHLSSSKKSLLVGCGAAGAISGIFNSPIAGVIFSIEVLLTSASINSFIPLLIASVAGSVVSLMFLGNDVLFSFQLADPFAAGDVPWYFLLGVCCGFFAVYFTRVSYVIEGFFTNSIQFPYRKAVLGGLVLMVIIFLFPSTYGEGYETIKLMLAQNNPEAVNRSAKDLIDSYPTLLFLSLFGLLLIKPVATAITIGAGGNGGIFAPSLFSGGVLGFLFAGIVNIMPVSTEISISNFTLVGMCGVMSGILHAPLTAIFLIAEITGGYTLFIPLMLVSAISYSTIMYFEKYSLYVKGLVKKGYLSPDDRDMQVLNSINIIRLIEKDLNTVSPDSTLEDLVNTIKKSKRNIFPVINENRELIGIITLDDIRKIMFDEVAQKNLLVKNLMHAPPDRVSSSDTMKTVMEKFEKTGAWNLPVIDHGRYVGFVSKSRIFNAYRHKLIFQNQV
jgi:chloride channel protein, CIC family